MGFLYTRFIYGAIGECEEIGTFTILFSKPASNARELFGAISLVVSARDVVITSLLRGRPEGLEPQWMEHGKWFDEWLEQPPLRQ